MSGICQQAQILILEIAQCIPVVKIFAFLDLEQISGDFEIEHFETGSP